MNQKTVLVIGSGGREQALILKLLQSPGVKKIYVTPGNASVAGLNKVEVATISSKPIDIADHEALAAFAQGHNVDLTIVGPEVPLCKGLVDFFLEKKLRIFGPNKKAAWLERSKAFAKQVMISCGVPTAAFRIFEEGKYNAALKYVTQHFDLFTTTPIVIKADGLASGKGVTICKTLDQATATLESLMVKKVFDGAGEKVVIEEFLEGTEISFTALCDGNDVIVLKPTRDHKQVDEGNTGPMTGGMGAYGPVKGVTDLMLKDFMTEKILPVFTYLKERHGIEYRGVLYIALMYTADGIKVLEWNVRFGDPETQVLLALMESDLLPYLDACVDGTLGKLPPIEWEDKHAVCVAVCERPYPEKPKGGKVITGLEAAAAVEGVALIHAGTALDAHGNVVTAGGRVIYVVCVADSLKDAQQRANEAAALIKFEGAFYRHDIGPREEQPLVA